MYYKDNIYDVYVYDNKASLYSFINGRNDNAIESFDMAALHNTLDMSIFERTRRFLSAS